MTSGLKRYEIVFRVNGNRTVQIVTARDLASAKRLIEAQYAGTKISYVTTKEVRDT